MKSRTIGLTLAMAGLAAGMAEPAAANGGRNAPGIRVMSSGVPVPAPAPVPDMPSLWYVSLGMGYAMSSMGDIRTNGPDVGAYKDFGDIDGPMNFGFAVGRKFWGNWRGEVDFTFRPKQKVSKANTPTYTAQGAPIEAENVSVTGVVAGTTTTLTTRSWDVSSYNVSRDEEARSANQTAMLNLYYDIPTGSIFTPYVGGGIGLVMRQSTREYKESGSCTGTVQSFNSPFTGNVVNVNRPNCTGPQTVDGEGSKQTTGYGFAGALMAGLATEVARGVVFDVGYRFIWQDAGTKITLPAAVGPDSTLKFYERADHEIRASVRWQID